MISVYLLRNHGKKAGYIVEGHANSAPYGEDLVCAAVSTVSVGGLNAIAHFLGETGNKFEYDMQEGFVSVRVHELEENGIQTVLETLEISFKTIAESYGKYIRIIDQEV